MYSTKSTREADGVVSRLLTMNLAKIFMALWLSVAQVTKRTSSITTAQTVSCTIVHWTHPMCYQVGKQYLLAWEQPGSILFHLLHRFITILVAMKRLLSYSLIHLLISTHPLSPMMALQVFRLPPAIPRHKTAKAGAGHP